METIFTASWRKNASECLFACHDAGKVQITSASRLLYRTPLAHTKIYLIFHKNQIKSIIEIGLTEAQKADFRR